MAARPRALLGMLDGQITRLNDFRAERVTAAQMIQQAYRKHLDRTRDWQEAVERGAAIHVQKTWRMVVAFRVALRMRRRRE